MLRISAERKKLPSIYPPEHEERCDRLEWPLEFVFGNPGHINE
jgi:hypothetical protein